MADRFKVRKIKVVWNDGEEDIFKGSFQWYSGELWVVDFHTDTPTYIPSGQVRYIKVVE